MYDLVIVGSGPAGLSAAVYASRELLNFIVIEKDFGGIGQIMETDRVDNYLGLYHESGYDLGTKFREHAKKLGTEFIYANVKSIEKHGDIFKIISDETKEIEAKAVIYAGGTTHRKLGILGEAELTGKGVSYCAVCDGTFYRGKDVAVVGGGDTALNDAIFLSKICRKVYLIHRRDEFRANKYLQNQVTNIENIELVLKSTPREIHGNSKVNSLILNTENGERKLDVSGIFIAIGLIPQTDPVKNLGVTDEYGYIIADEDGVTNVAGFFAGGDARKKKLYQLITAAADGANCTESAAKYLDSLK